jgi:hypothetical protein
MAKYGCSRRRKHFQPLEHHPPNNRPNTIPNLRPLQCIFHSNAVISCLLDQSQSLRFELSSDTIDKAFLKRNREIKLALSQLVLYIKPLNDFLDRYNIILEKQTRPKRFSA